MLHGNKSYRVNFIFATETFICGVSSKAEWVTHLKNLPNLPCQTTYFAIIDTYIELLKPPGAVNKVSDTRCIANKHR